MSASMFERDHLVITGTLEVCSPLMLGSGKRRGEEVLGMVDEALVEASQIVTDHQGNPYLPGSSLKGVLRRLVPDAPAADLLFGPEHGSGTAQGMGHLVVYGAECQAAGLPAAAQVPYYNQSSGSGINARTAIDAKTGTADKHKLIHERQVPKGTRLALHMDLLLTGNDAVEALLGNILAAMHQGFAMGRGTGSGQGRLKLIEHTLSVEGISADGDWGKVTAHHNVVVSTPAVSEDQSIMLRLSCDGPFIVNDSSWKRVENDNSQPHLMALGADSESREQLPVLPGTSLRGALRSLSRWLESGDSQLTDQLFGTVDHAASLRIMRIETSPARLLNLTSVKIDRFSAAPIEGALFGTRAFCDPVFEVVLQTPLAGDAAKHCDRLVEELIADGIRLGHGTNRGYGWFKVERV